MTDHNLKLWGIGTSRTMRAHWALLEIGAPYDCEPILPRTGETKTAQFTAINPRQRVYDIVGRPLCDHCCPERLGRDGTLHVRVSGGWALELTHLEPLVIERIAGYFGYPAITRLALMQGPLPSRPKRRARRVRPLDDDGERALVECIAATE